MGMTNSQTPSQTESIYTVHNPQGARVARAVGEARKMTLWTQRWVAQGYTVKRIDGRGKVTEYVPGDGTVSEWVRKHGTVLA
jgi:hypothetical protein